MGVCEAAIKPRVSSVRFALVLPQNVARGPFDNVRMSETLHRWDDVIWGFGRFKIRRPRHDPVTEYTGHGGGGQGWSIADAFA